MLRLTVALLLVLFGTSVARAQSTPVAPMTEAQFIEIAGAPKDGDTAGGEQGRPMEPAKGTETLATKEEADDEDDDAGADDEGADADEDDDAKGGAGDGDADDDEDDAGESDGAGDGKDATEQDEEGDEPPTEPTAAENAAFKKALEKEGVSTSLEDIPEAARPIVAKKLRDLERGFHARTQALAEDRKAARAFKVEERFRREKPVDFILSMLLEHPEYSDLVNEKVAQLDGNATALEGHKALVEQARREAASAEATEEQKQQAHVDKIDGYIRLGRAAARAAGVPFDAGVEDAMAARLALGEALSEADIRQIAKQKARVYQRTQRETKRARSGQYVADKVADRKKAGLKAKPGQGRAPTPAAKTVAKNDQEFIEEFTARTG